MPQSGKAGVCLCCALFPKPWEGHTSSKLMPLGFLILRKIPPIRATLFGHVGQWISGVGRNGNLLVSRLASSTTSLPVLGPPTRREWSKD